MGIRKRAGPVKENIAGTVVWLGLLIGDGDCFVFAFSGSNSICRSFSFARAGAFVPDFRDCLGEDADGL